MDQYRVLVDLGLKSEQQIAELAKGSAEMREIDSGPWNESEGRLIFSILGSKDQSAVQAPTPPVVPPVVVVSGPTAGPDGKTPVPPATSASPSPPAAPASDAELNAKARVIEEGLSALSPPDSIWQDITDGNARSELALAVVKQVFDERSDYARAAAFVFAPELDLLGRAGSDELAKRMLECREHITEQDGEKAKQDVALAAVRVEIEHERIELEHQRAALMKEVVGYADERVKHMRRWREISEFGPKVLIGSLAGAAALIAYTLLALVPRGHVSGEAAALIIFTFAVFVSAPATLLLRERPLRGIDQFMPGGKADAPAEDANTPADKAGSGPDPKSSDQAKVVSG